jgi:photosystem II stability/assembly factor-like uncharacterized protein
MKTNIKIIAVLLILLNTSFAQQIIWNHLNGPMGGIIGDLGITSNGDLYAGVYPFWQIYSGLFKSTDNGNSWEKVVTPFNEFEVYSIYITKDDHIWVGTNFQDRIYLSTDNGQSWAIKSNGYSTGECWAFGQSKDGILFAGDGQYQNTFRSTNYGESWMFSAPLRPLVFATDSNNVVFAGTHDGLFATTDNGITWAQNNFLSNIAVSSILIDSRNNIYCGTGYYSNGNGVFYSSDGGQNWTQIGLAGKVILSLAFDSNGHLYAGSSEDGLFKTTDMGNTWVNYQNGLYRKNIFRLKINSDDDIFIGSEDEGVFRSTDNGNSFEQIGVPISRVNNIVFNGDSLIFTSTPSGVQKYNRQTGKWTNLGLHQVEAITITPNNNLFAAALDGLYESFDLGKTWSKNNYFIDSLISVYNVLAINNDTIFVATWPNLMRSVDGGENWTNLSGVKTGFLQSSLFYNKFDKSFFTSSTENSEYVLLKSSDYGYTFNNVITEIGSMYNYSISFNQNIGCLATGGLNGAVYISLDSGDTWFPILSNNNYRSVYIDNFGVVIVGSYGGLYYSNDYGNDFTTIEFELGENNYVSSIEKREKFYLGTYRTGLYEFDIITSLEEPKEIFNYYILAQNYPNPFNPSTTINYSIKDAGLVSLKVFDILGREVAVLVNDNKEAGYHSVEFNASNLPSGIFIYTLQVNGYTNSKKMLLLK